MIEIDIRGFQSIEHARIQVEGFTALVGRSNVGKSAIVRAVKAALTNASGTSFVRHNVACARKLKGQKTCKCTTTVHIQMPGLDLLWEKGDGTTAYKVNGVDLSAMEKGSPEFLSHHGLSPVVMGDKSRLLQIADQFFPVFLLDQGGSTVANVLSDVARLDAVNFAAKLVEKDRREASSLRKTREKDVLELTAKHAVYDGLDNTETTLVDVETRLEGILESETKKAQVEAYLSTIRTTYDEITRVAKVETLPAPSVTALQEKRDKVLTVTAFYESFAERGRAVKHLSGVDAISSPDVSKVKSMAATAWETAVFHDRLTELLTTIKSARGVETVKELSSSDITEKAATVDQFGSWVSRMANIKQWGAAWKPIVDATIPDHSKLALLSGKLGTMGTLASRMTSMSGSIRTLEEEIAALDKEVHDVGEEMKTFGGVCPTCAQPLHGGAHKESLNGQGRLHLQD